MPTNEATASAVSVDDVQHVARLANVALTDAELPKMVRDLGGILGYFGELSAVDTAGVAPMAQVADVLGAEVATHGETLRADSVRTSLPRAEVMAEAPETDGRFFKVPKVIER